MAAESNEFRQIRISLISLLENDEYIILDDVETEAKQTLGAYQKCTSQYDVVDFVLSLLKTGFQFSSVELTDPRYRPGTGYVMKKPNGWDIYIKIRITESICDPKAHIMSFHPERPY